MVIPMHLCQSQLLLYQRNRCFPEATLILISRRRSRCNVPRSGGVPRSVDVPRSGLFPDLVPRPQCLGNCWVPNPFLDQCWFVPHWTNADLSAAFRSFTQSFIRAHIKENIKARRHYPFWGEFIGDRWTPAQKASNAENASIWWRHRELCGTSCASIISQKHHMCAQGHPSITLINVDV